MDITQSFTNCPQCGKHCPLDAPSCGRGRELAEKLKSGAQIDFNSFNTEHNGKNHRHHRGSGHHHEYL